MRISHAKITPSRIFLALLQDRECPSAAIVRLEGIVAGYGDSRAAAWLNFVRQLQGAEWSTQRMLFSKSEIVAISDDTASDIVEMLESPEHDTDFRWIRET